MRKTRPLTEADCQQIIDLYTYIQKFQFKRVPQITYDYFTDKNKIIELLNEEGAVHVGTFENGELISALKMSFWKHLPHWSLGHVATKIQTVSFDMTQNGLAETTKFAIELAEDRGCYRFYTAISQRQMMNKLLQKWPEHVSSLRDYLYVIEGEFDVNEKSNFLPFEMMLSVARLQNPNLKYYIRSATATNARRKFKILKVLK